MVWSSGEKHEEGGVRGWKGLQEVGGVGEERRGGGKHEQGVGVEGAAGIKKDGRGGMEVVVGVAGDTCYSVPETQVYCWI